MNFYKDKLIGFNLCKMYDELIDKYSVIFCDGKKSTELELSKNEEIEDILKEKKYLYYFFGNRNNESLNCINGKSYVVDDERQKESNGIFMSDAYFNKYDDINLGFLLSYDNDILEIQPAIEGEGVEFRQCETIDDCGDLNIEMQQFINKFII